MDPWHAVVHCAPMTSVRSVLSPLLVGRDELLVLAERRIAEAADSRGRTCFLAGEAGSASRG